MSAQLSAWRPLKEAAVLLGISTDALRKRASRGTIPSRKEGRRLFIYVQTDANGQDPDTSGQVSALADENSSAKNDHFDELAEAWAKDLRRQVERLERQNDTLIEQIEAAGERHGETERRLTSILKACGNR